MTEPKLVVGAAIVREDRGVRRVLACRRTSPPDAAGRWEFPGGKVEPGESAEDAVVREIGEELRCLVEVTGWLPGEEPIGSDLVLRVALARVTAGELRPREHDHVRWLEADELDDVAWLEADRPFLAVLGATLRGDRPADTVRAVFFDEDEARTVVDTLHREGWRADLTRERYHGEDDDEDHPWAVLTDAPLLAVELLVDEFDGWLDVTGTDPADPVSLGIAPEPLDRPAPLEPPEPPDLPDAPRRIKRPERGPDQR